MKAMILAAGMGTRLRPLTDEKPKALVPVVGKPAILWNIEYLKRYGVTNIILNAHHHYEQILEFFDKNSALGVEIRVRVEPEILGTGGGIKNTEDFWDDESFIVLNGDILTNIPLDQAYAHHVDSGAPATMILHDHPPFNKIRIDSRGPVKDIPRTYGTSGLAFTGIHILRPGLLNHLPGEVFSDIIDCYRGLIQAGETIQSFVARDHYWYDIGTPDDYLRANRDLSGKSIHTGPRAQVHPTARLEGWAVIGADCFIEEHATVRRSILWDGARVRKGEVISDTVLTPLRAVKLKTASQGV
ncbi:MAG: NDP-sugar synthase [Deltaproteobacteria bacterium]|nr:NDP-sugar synthase [Deltaproteobacteria bacterium]MBW2015312.1 NDP-sugar synthase [Deltaproteobacteria bacterium]MBW2127846.1 NDP-sugar synthase [Deltaproteobacteria bacterium]MBW2302130.1 NDP-sugar synthase [Deltaproteobacteria bacterium]